MKKRWVGLVIGAALLVVGLGAGAFMVMRMRMMGGGGQPAGGLTAITSKGQPLAADPNLKLPANAAAQKVGDLTVMLALSPYPPVGFNAAAFDVTLTDAAGAAVTDATITLDLTMPAMPMPVNKPAAEHADDGLYHAPGRFTMRGEWWIEVIIERGGQQQSAFFSVWL